MRSWAGPFLTADHILTLLRCSVTKCPPVMKRPAFNCACSEPTTQCLLTKTEMSAEGNRSFIKRMAKFRAEMDHVWHILLKGKYPPDLTETQKRSFRRQKGKYMIKEGKLCRKWKDSWVQVVTSPEEVCEILKFYHVTSGSHMGMNNTSKRISVKYYWNCMAKDIREYISTCPTCQSFQMVKTQAPLMKQIRVTQPMEVVHPMEVVVMDLIGQQLQESWGKKRRARLEVAEPFNATYPDEVPRTIHQLRRSYDHIKRKVKSEDNSYKKKMKATSGGPPPSPPKVKEETAITSSMMQVDLAMRDDAYDTFNQIPASEEKPCVLTVSDPGFWHQHQLERPSTSISTSTAPFNPIHSTGMTSSLSTPVCSVPSVSASSSAVDSVPLVTSITHSTISPPLKPITSVSLPQSPHDSPLTSLLTSAVPSSVSVAAPTPPLTRTAGKHNGRKDFQACHKRQEEYHALQLQQMKELHTLQVEGHKLRNELLKEKKKTMVLVQNSLECSFKKFNEVLDVAERAYTAMANFYE